MAHFARVLNGIVEEVIVAEQDFIDNLVYDKPGKWIQTSYNTKGGVHTEGGTPLRKNFAGKGWTYDKTRDAFIPPKEYESYVLNEDTCLWEPPVARPDDENRYAWNEPNKRWDVIDM